MTEKIRKIVAQYLKSQFEIKRVIEGVSMKFTG